MPALRLPRRTTATRRAQYRGVPGSHRVARAAGHTGGLADRRRSVSAQGLDRADPGDPFPRHVLRGPDRGAQPDAQAAGAGGRGRAQRRGRLARRAGAAARQGAQRAGLVRPGRGYAQARTRGGSGHQCEHPDRRADHAGPPGPDGHHHRAGRDALADPADGRHGQCGRQRCAAAPAVSAAGADAAARQALQGGREPRAADERRQQHRLLRPL